MIAMAQQAHGMMMIQQEQLRQMAILEQQAYMRQLQEERRAQDQRAGFIPEGKSRPQSYQEMLAARKAEVAAERERLRANARSQRKGDRLVAKAGA